MVGKTSKAIAWLAEQEREKEWEIKPYRHVRSNRQNAYYWRLLTDVANQMRMSKAECHNQMLRDYGQPVMIGGEVSYVMLPDTEQAEKDALRAETFHVRPTSIIRSGKGSTYGYRAYMILRGSHEYNTYEMSVLLDGLIQEAKQLGIETMTPYELARMREHDLKTEDKKREKEESLQRDTV